MPDFPRTVQPRAASPFVAAGPLIAKGSSGKNQLRSTGAIGRAWTETYPPIKTSDPLVRGWLAIVKQMWRLGTIFDIVHPAYTVAYGVGTGTPLVMGASQTGNALLTDGWTPSITNILRAGDLLRISGLTQAFDICADVNSNGSGQATLSIDPPILVGGSPADNAALTVNGVKIRAALIAPPAVGEIGGVYVLDGFQLSFAEMP